MKERFRHLEGERYHIYTCEVGYLKNHSRRALLVQRENNRETTFVTRQG